MRLSRLRALGRPITIEDLRNPSLPSGFNYVSSASAGPNGGGKTKLWRANAYGGKKDSAGRSWHGRTRQNAEDAAHDFVRWFNDANTLVPRSINKSHGHPTKRTKKAEDPEVAAARAVLRDAKKTTKAGWVYLIGETGDDDFLKIGKSTDEPQFRLGGMQTGNPRTLYVIASLKTKDCHALEAELHGRFYDLHKGGEWFRTDPSIFERFGIKKKKEVKTSA